MAKYSPTYLYPSERKGRRKTTQMEVLLEIEKHHRCYAPGDAVHGTITVKSPTSCAVSGIFVQCRALQWVKGYQQLPPAKKTHGHRGPKSSEPVAAVNEPELPPRANHVYVEDQAVEMENEEDQDSVELYHQRLLVVDPVEVTGDSRAVSFMIPPGAHTYRFTVVLPPNLVGSYAILQKVSGIAVQSSSTGGGAMASYAVHLSPAAVGRISYVGSRVAYDMQASVSVAGSSKCSSLAGTSLTEMQFVVESAKQQLYVATAAMPYGPQPQKGFIVSVTKHAAVAAADEELQSRGAAGVAEDYGSAAADGAKTGKKTSCLCFGRSDHHASVQAGSYGNAAGAEDGEYVGHHHDQRKEVSGKVLRRMSRRTPDLIRVSVAMKTAYVCLPNNIPSILSPQSSLDANEMNDAAPFCYLSASSDRNSPGLGSMEDPSGNPTLEMDLKIVNDSKKSFPLFLRVLLQMVTSYEVPLSSQSRAPFGTPKSPSSSLVGCNNYRSATTTTTTTPVVVTATLSARLIKAIGEGTDGKVVELRPGMSASLHLVMALPQKLEMVDSHRVQRVRSYMTDHQQTTPGAISSHHRSSTPRASSQEARRKKQNSSSLTVSVPMTIPPTVETKQFSARTVLVVQLAGIHNNAEDGKCLLECPIEITALPPSKK